MANSHKVKFIEASAKSRHNVNDVFVQLSKEILEFRKTLGNLSGGNFNTTIEPTEVQIGSVPEKKLTSGKKHQSCLNGCCGN